MNIQQILSERRRARDPSMQEEPIKRFARKIIENTLFPIFSEMEEKFQNTITFELDIHWNPNDRNFFELWMTPQLKKHHMKKLRYPNHLIENFHVEDAMDAVIELAPEYGIRSYPLQSADVVVCEVQLSLWRPKVS